MSENKHTPGPWRVRHSVTQMCDEGTTITSVGGSDREHIPRWWIFSDAETHADPAADAYLIASAPDLLEALEGLVACISETRGIPAHEALKAARAAIHKARGKV